MTAFVSGSRKNRKRILLVILVFLTLLTTLLSIRSSQTKVQHALRTGVKRVSASGGYIIEHDGFYYYANPADGNRLYRADAALQNPQKLSDHANKSPYIQLTAVGTQVFYLQRAETEGDTVQNRLCAYDIAVQEETVLFDKNVISYLVTDEWIYCESVSPAQTYRLRLDGTAAQKVGEELPDAYARRKWVLAEDAVFYITHEGIIKYDPVSGQAAAFPGYSADFAVNGSEIYSINYNDRYALEQYDAETMSYADKKTIVPRNVDSFALSDQTLVYATKSGLMWIKNTEKKGKTFLGFGHNPIICGQFMFYMHAGDEIRYLGNAQDGIL